MMMTNYPVRLPGTKDVGKTRHPLPRSWEQLNSIDDFKSVDAESLKPYPIMGTPRSSLKEGNLYIRKLRSRMLVGLKRTLIIGAPGGGKSYTLRSILYKMRKFYGAVMAINPSESSNQWYSGMIPALHVHNVWDYKLLNKFVNRQSMAVSTAIHNPAALLVFDDVTEGQNMLINPAMRTLWLRGRHLGAAILAARQYTTQLPTFCRSSVSYVIITSMGAARDRKQVYDQWANGLFATYAEFDAVYSRVSESKKYTHLVLRLNDTHLPPEECIYYFRACTDIPEQFRVGHPQTWQHCERRIDTAKLNTVPILTDF
jgi:hypothetical protein